MSPHEPRRGSLLVIFLTVFIDLLGFGMVLPLLPIYGEVFGEQYGLHENDPKLGLLIGILMSVFSLMQFVFAPLWGRLSDRIGRRPVLMIGLTGSVVFYTLFGVATIFKSYALLFVSRLGAGIAGATISTAQAYIADTTTLEKRARGMALIGAAFGLGFTFGPIFGVLAVPNEHVTWALHFIPGAESLLHALHWELGPGPGYAAAILSACALLLAYFKLPESMTPESRPAARKWLDLNALREALSIPSIGPLLLAIFICIFAFANFESTLSLTLKGAYKFDIAQICLTFAYIGIVLTLVQGGIVRRIAGRVSEGKMAAGGAIAEIFGFFLLAQATNLPSLLTGLAVIVTGFAFVNPSLSSLLSRRSDPARQGGILGIGQSISSLARILGPMVGVPLFKNEPLAERLHVGSATLPLALGACMMAVGLALILMAARNGRDFPAAEAAEDAPVGTL